MVFGDEIGIRGVISVLKTKEVDCIPFFDESKRVLCRKKTKAKGENGINSVDIFEVQGKGLLKLRRNVAEKRFCQTGYKKEVNAVGIGGVSVLVGDY